MRVLVVNAGSSGLELSLIDPDEHTLSTCELSVPGAEIERDTVRVALAEMRKPDAVGYRIVHGGERFRGPIRIDPEGEAALRELVDLAPLHQPESLAALDIVSSLMPSLLAVASFDTGFHRTLTPAASTYALPRGGENDSRSAATPFRVSHMPTRRGEPQS